MAATIPQRYWTRDNFELLANPSQSSTLINITELNSCTHSSCSQESLLQLALRHEQHSRARRAWISSSSKPRELGGGEGRRRRRPIMNSTPAPRGWFRPWGFTSETETTSDYTLHTSSSWMIRPWGWLALGGRPRPSKRPFTWLKGNFPFSKTYSSRLFKWFNGHFTFPRSLIEAFSHDLRALKPSYSWYPFESRQWDEPGGASRSYSFGNYLDLFMMRKSY